MTGVGGRKQITFSVSDKALIGSECKIYFINKDVRKPLNKGWE